ncbi:hypothetical protein CONCODRAFT_86638 [Conidiobolus coronatus NRRL 28638]|uniref:SNRNP25 ubiquitin-like domain-containing protein n=1 Tax=Conidiobolus coronatus (strain ATCC 28846 / CBS 209.66 / NRRL 28638) TaxID=796925 RepID=A0A137NZU1_CONC2|nr:hypothetical protein CONCODRAFT_86638 [Conidiobolus coronatus NRRL 28638]|eukprot:KXN68109.1 hypothetical protein CONCODRAFT_86638 [Conidiobolus coronatus NRRL 28638]
MNHIDKELEDLLKDPLLSDINQFTSLNQVKHLIQLERGNLIKLTLLRGSLQAIELSLNEFSTLEELKKLIQLHIASQLNSTRSNLKINWKFTWNRNKLSTLRGLELEGDKNTLRQLGIKNNDMIKFVKIKKVKTK